MCEAVGALRLAQSQSVASIQIVAFLPVLTSGEDYTTRWPYKVSIRVFTFYLLSEIPELALLLNFKIL